MDNIEDAMTMFAGLPATLRTDTAAALRSMLDMRSTIMEYAANEVEKQMLSTAPSSLPDEVRQQVRDELTRHVGRADQFTASLDEKLTTIVSAMSKHVHDESTSFEGLTVINVAMERVHDYIARVVDTGSNTRILELLTSTLQGEDDSPIPESLRGRLNELLLDYIKSAITSQREERAIEADTKEFATALETA